LAFTLAGGQTGAGCGGQAWAGAAAIGAELFAAISVFEAGRWSQAARASKAT
jgi:hypothetical protein